MQRRIYLTVAEVAERIKFSKQTLYNMISTKKLVKGEHYIKPSRKKVLFRWLAVQAWLEDQDNDSPDKPHNDDHSSKGGIKKILLKWSGLQAWRNHDSTGNSPDKPRTGRNTVKSRINI